MEHGQGWGCAGSGGQSLAVGPQMVKHVAHSQPPLELWDVAPREASEEDLFGVEGRRVRDVWAARAHTRLHADAGEGGGRGGERGGGRREEGGKEGG